MSLTIAVVVLMSACGPGEREQPPERGESPQAVPSPDGGDDRSPSGALDFDDLETVAEGLEVPWDLAFLPNGAMLVTERGGRIRAIRDGEVVQQPVGEIDTVAEGEGGLMGITAHPEFDREPYVYVTYTSASGNRVSRFRIDDDLRLGDEEILMDEIPAATFHNGAGIAFGPDGMLYVTTGDAQQPVLAADLDSPAGKVLRLTPGGDVPDDNPFGQRPVFSYGHRNPQGFDWDEEGRMFASEHGPTGELGLCCLDELNVIEAGGFYGWPFTMGGVEVMAGQPPQSPVDPIAHSGPDSTWAPAGLAVHDRGGRTDVYVATLAGQQLLRFVVENGTGSVSDPEVLVDDLGRLRIATMGPDGCLYVGTSNREGRGDPRSGDDRIVRACA